MTVNEDNIEVKITTKRRSVLLNYTTATDVYGEKLYTVETFWAREIWEDKLSAISSLNFELEKLLE